MVVSAPLRTLPESPEMHDQLHCADWRSAGGAPAILRREDRLLTRGDSALPSTGGCEDRLLARADSAAIPACILVIYQKKKLFFDEPPGLKTIDISIVHKML